MPLAVGLMSGTSINGIDAALVRLSGRGDAIRIRLIDYQIFPISPAVRERILGAVTREEICRLNFSLGLLFAGAVKRLLKKNRIPLRRLAFIGSHGQTVCHLGPGGTLQLGEPSVIAEETGVTTVADFRPRDIAAGGHGAPLAPYFHYLLCRDPRRNIAVQNIGGIGNLTFIPRGGGLGRVIGFDTGPGNMVIDGLVREVTRGRIPFDRGGRLAARGLISLPLLRELMRHPFIRRKPPKSSGREDFGSSTVEKILKEGKKRGLKLEDLVATATAWTAVSIAENYRRFIFPRGIPEEIIFGGGGVKNPTLMRMLRRELAGIRLTTFEEKGIPSDAVEAVCFAVLAYKTLLGEPANLPSVTGAKRPVILGKIIPGRRGVPSFP